MLLPKSIEREEEAGEVVTTLGWCSTFRMTGPHVQNRLRVHRKSGKGLDPDHPDGIGIVRGGVVQIVDGTENDCSTL